MQKQNKSESESEGNTWSYKNLAATFPVAWRKNLTDSLGSKSLDNGSSWSTYNSELERKV